MKPIEIAELPEEEEPELPSLKDPGRILVRAFGLSDPYPDGSPNVYRLNVEVLDHDGCTHWIQEGEGFDHFLDSFDELEKPGVYVIEGIVGTYHRGDGYATDDDVEWDWKGVRPATEREEMGEALGPDLKPFWMSWWHHDRYGAFELHSPWWSSGFRGDDATSICAAVLAEDEEAAREVVLASYDKRPDDVEWRFTEERPLDWSPFTSRFRKADWMKWE